MGPVSLPAHSAPPKAAVTTAHWEPGGDQGVCGNHSFVTGLLISWSLEFQGREVGGVKMVDSVTHRPCEHFGFPCSKALILGQEP